MALSPGTRLGVFEIAQLIGAGGMGEVYRARDTNLGSEVAIKVLPEGFAKDSERLARFEREARILAQLDHQNIATVHEFRKEDDISFIVMQDRGITDALTADDHFLQAGFIPLLSDR